jgi:hypothetical protein
MAVSRKPSCPGGFILRESYRSKSGKCVAARCVRKTGIMSGKSSNRTARLLKKADERALHALRLSKKAGLNVPMNCPKGMTMRRGYTRRSYNRRTGIHVRHALARPACIKTRGKQIKNKNQNKASIIILDPDDHYLSEYGYFDVENKSIEERHLSLHKLINHFIPIKGEMATYNYVIRALNARYILNRNTNRKTASIFKKDQRAISKEYKKIKNNKSM